MNQSDGIRVNSSKINDVPEKLLDVNRCSARNRHSEISPKEMNEEKMFDKRDDQQDIPIEIARSEMEAKTISRPDLRCPKINKRDVRLETRKKIRNLVSDKDSRFSDAYAQTDDVTSTDVATQVPSKSYTRTHAQTDDVTSTDVATQVASKSYTTTNVQTEYDRSLLDYSTSLSKLFKKMSSYSFLKSDRSSPQTDDIPGENEREDNEEDVYTTPPDYFPKREKNGERIIRTSRRRRDRNDVHVSDSDVGKSDNNSSKCRQKQEDFEDLSCSSCSIDDQVYQIQRKIRRLKRKLHKTKKKLRGDLQVYDDFSTQICFEQTEGESTRYRNRRFEETRSILEPYLIQNKLPISPPERKVRREKFMFSYETIMSLCREIINEQTCDI